MLPAVKCTAGSLGTLADGAYYGLGQLVGANPSAFGLMGDILVMNDPGDGSGVFNIYNDDRVQVWNGTHIFHVWAGVRFDANFTGTATLFMGHDSLSSFEDPIEVTLIDPVANDNNPILSFSVIMIYPAVPFDVGAAGNTLKLVQPIVIQETGGDLDISDAWYRIVRLSQVDTDNTLLFTE